MSIEDSASSQDKYGLVGTAGYTAPELGSMDYSYKVVIPHTCMCIHTEDVTHFRWIFGHVVLCSMEC